MTPEGRVKRDLKEALGTVEAEDPGHLYSHWPVINGMGTPEIDCNIVYHGVAYAIECKAVNEKLTARQRDTMLRKRAAGVITLAVGGELVSARGHMVVQAKPADLELVYRVLRAYPALRLEGLQEHQPYFAALMKNWRTYGLD